MMIRRQFIFLLVLAATLNFSTSETIGNFDNNNYIDNDNNNNNYIDNNNNNYIDGEYYDSYDNEVDSQNSRVGFVEKEERFFGVTSVFEYLADPNNEAFFVIRMFFQWVSLMAGFAVIHFSTWDYSDTQPGEEVNFIRLFNFFADPETPLLVTTILIGHAVVASALFFIPALFWPGAPIPVTPTKVNLERSSARCSTKRSSSALVDALPMAMRSILSPDGMSRTMIAMSMEHMGFILFWLLSPYFTGSAFSSSSSSTSGRCIREAESGEDLNDMESFILKSINKNPATFSNKTVFDLH